MILLIAVGSIATYLVLSIAVFPTSYLGTSISPQKPAPVIASVTIEPIAIKLGQQVQIKVIAVNSGGDADMQTISSGFPNLTDSKDIQVMGQNLEHAPIMVSHGTKVGYGYTGTQQTVQAKYAAVEVQGWPWRHGETHEVDLKVTPQTAGNFVVLIKSVAMPHTDQRSHFPSNGTVDQQGEFVQVYALNVTKP